MPSSAELFDRARVARRLPVIALRDGPVFPDTQTELVVGRPASIAAARVAFETDQLVLALCQRDSCRDEPDTDGYFEIGCITHIVLEDHVDEALKLAATGVLRARVGGVYREGEAWFATVAPLEEPPGTNPMIEETKLAVLRELAAILLQIEFPADAEPAVLVNAVAAQLALDPAQAQWFLETPDLMARVERILDVRQLAFEDARAMEERVKRRSIVTWLFRRPRSTVTWLFGRRR